MPAGNDSNTASGITKLSYWEANTRYTKMKTMMNTYRASLPR